MRLFALHLCIATLLVVPSERVGASERLAWEHSATNRVTAGRLATDLLAMTSGIHVAELARDEAPAGGSVFVAGWQVRTLATSILVGGVAVTGAAALGAWLRRRRMMQGQHSRGWGHAD
jgi:hypothetical protein